jgi:glucosylceramidase
MRMKNIFLLIILISATSSFAQNRKPTFREKNMSAKNVIVYTTADSTNLRLSVTNTLKFSSLQQPLESQICVFVDPAKTFQTFVGIGGALTDAAAETFAKLPVKKQNELLKAYYDKKDGIGYTIARTNMNSCDFSSDLYTYVTDGDISLQSFNIDHDKKFKIPLIKKAMVASHGTLHLFSSPWSPPAYMKDNNDMLHGGKLLPKYFKSWATYYTKFIKAYQKEGVPMWGITIQNEPMAKQIWESCIYTADDEKNFLKNYLGPQMKRAGLGNTKIIVWDHNRDMIYQRSG